MTRKKQSGSLQIVRHYAFEETSGTEFFDLNGVNKLTLSAGNISTITTTDSFSGNAVKFTATAQIPIEPYSSDFTFRDANGNKPFDIEYYAKDLIGSSRRIPVRIGNSNPVIFCDVNANILKLIIYKQDGTNFGVQMTYPVNSSIYRKFLFQYRPGQTPMILINDVAQITTNFGTEGDIKIATPDLLIGGLEREGYMDEFKLRIG